MEVGGATEHNRPTTQYERKGREGRGERGRGEGSEGEGEGRGGGRGRGRKEEGERWERVIFNIQSLNHYETSFTRDNGN